MLIICDVWCLGEHKTRNSKWNTFLSIQLKKSTSSDAIRYTASFVLDVLQPSEDEENTLADTIMGRHGSFSQRAEDSVSGALERKCRRGVSSAFSLTAEKEMAVCLFHAVRDYILSIFPSFADQKCFL